MVHRNVGGNHRTSDDIWKSYRPLPCTAVQRFALTRLAAVCLGCTMRNHPAVVLMVQQQQQSMMLNLEAADVSVGGDLSVVHHSLLHRQASN